MGASIKLPDSVQAVHSALLVVACFGNGLAPLAAAHVRISDLSAADSPAPGALAWRRVDLSAASNVSSGVAAGYGKGVAGSGPPAAVLLGQLYRESPLGAAAQWRAVVAAARAPAGAGLVPGSVAAGRLQAGADEATQVAGRAAGDQPLGMDGLDAGNPDPGSAVSPDLAAFASDAAAARALLRGLLPLRKAAAVAAAAAAAAAEADQDEAAGAGADAGANVGPGSGSWRLRGEARAVAGGAIVDVAQELQRNACYQGRAPARMPCLCSPMQV